MIERFKSTLQTSGHSLTNTRQLVFEKLAKHGPIATAQLATICAPTVDRATVYRTIELFEKLGIVNRLWHGFKNRVELSEVFTPHHHHAVCMRCNAIIKIVDPELEKLLSGLAKKHNFLALTHILELNGYCKKCQ